MDKDDRTQESDERRGTTGTKPTHSRRDDAGSGKEKNGGRRQTDGHRETETRASTPTPRWARRDMEIEVGNQKPDGLIGHGGEDYLHYRRHAMQ